MVTLSDLEERETQLEELKSKTLAISRQRIPQRRFGTGVTSKQQQETIKTKQEAEITLKRINQAKKDLAEQKKEFKKQQITQRALGKIKKKARGRRIGQFDSEAERLEYERLLRENPQLAEAVERGALVRTGQLKPLIFTGKEIASGVSNDVMIKQQSFVEYKSGDTKIKIKETPAQKLEGVRIVDFRKGVGSSIKLVGTNVFDVPLKKVIARESFSRLKSGIELGKRGYKETPTGKGAIFLTPSENLRISDNKYIRRAQELTAFYKTNIEGPKSREHSIIKRLRTEDPLGRGRDLIKGVGSGVREIEGRADRRIPNVFSSRRNIASDIIFGVERRIPNTRLGIGVEVIKLELGARALGFVGKSVSKTIFPAQITSKVIGQQTQVKAEGESLQKILSGTLTKVERKTLLGTETFFVPAVTQSEVMRLVDKKTFEVTSGTVGKIVEFPRVNLLGKLKMRKTDFGGLALGAGLEKPLSIELGKNVFAGQVFTKSVEIPKGVVFKQATRVITEKGLQKDLLGVGTGFDIGKNKLFFGGVSREATKTSFKDATPRIDLLTGKVFQPGLKRNMFEVGIIKDVSKLDNVFTVKQAGISDIQKASLGRFNNLASIQAGKQTAVTAVQATRPGITRVPGSSVRTTAGSAQFTHTKVPKSENLFSTATTTTITRPETRFKQIDRASLSQIQPGALRAGQKTRLRQESVLGQQQLGLFRISQAVVPKAALAVKLRQGLKLRSRQQVKQTALRTRPLAIIPRIGAPFRLTAPVKIPKFDLKETGEGGPKVPGFKTFVIRGGKRVFLPGVRTKGQALRFGQTRTTQTLRATFGVVPTRTRVKARGNGFRPDRGIFREFKIRKGKKIPTVNVFIQKKGKRLASSSEVKAIHMARRLSL